MLKSKIRPITSTFVLQPSNWKGKNDMMVYFNIMKHERRIWRLFVLFIFCSILCIMTLNDSWVIVIIKPCKPYTKKNL